VVAKSSRLRRKGVFGKNPEGKKTSKKAEKEKGAEAAVVNANGKRS